MKTIVIFGASSGLGLAAVRYFASQDFNVVGIARNPQKEESLGSLCQQLIACDATDVNAVEAAVSQLPKDAVVLSTMGSFRSDKPVDYIGHRYLVDALERQGINRLLLVTSLGCGDSWQYLSERARVGFGAAVREKSLAEAWLASSSLDYTILRPGGLKDGEVTERGELSQHVEVHGAIHRSEVARLVHQLLLNDASIGQIYQCVDPTVSYY
ncbi:SDR family NAD(P)-dependent oxidoreductase [Vibrio maritimus]|jgi:NAD(P)-dependent dehydrogenase (short-subunit alcohol dehydrogenase family)|uniref:SDR family NAD(P)-dependent oxidoreductase n=1 Tax=Vibrio chaetopteri TaxID=3016528 RepID=A0AAU8BKU4_9VIBR